MNGWIRSGAGAAAVLFVGWVALALIEAASSPWARSLVGGQTLTGEWTGLMTTPTGKKHSVWIEIEHSASVAACYDCPAIEGRVATCDETGKRHDYEMWGNVDTWDGAAFHLRAREAEASPVHLLYLEGAWRADEIQLTTTLVAPGIPQTTRFEKNAAGEETLRIIDGHPDTRAPMRFSLIRGSEDDFKARCHASAP